MVDICLASLSHNIMLVLVIWHIKNGKNLNIYSHLTISRGCGLVELYRDVTRRFTRSGSPSSSTGIGLVFSFEWGFSRSHSVCLHSSCTKRHKMTRASTCPTHMRGPSPKGMNSKRSLAFVLMQASFPSVFSHRLGSKSSLKSLAFSCVS